MIWLLIFLLILVLSVAGYYAARFGRDWLKYSLAEAAQIWAIMKANFAYLTTDGDNVRKVHVNPTEMEWRTFYTQLKKINKLYEVHEGTPGTIWVGFPKKRFRVMAWAPTKWHEYVQGGIRHAIPLQTLILEYPFQPSDAELKNLEEKAEKARAVATTGKPGQVPIFLTPTDAERLAFMPTMRSRDQIEIQYNVITFIRIIDPFKAITKVTHFQDAIKDLIEPVMRFETSQRDFLSINVSPESGQQVVEFKTTALLGEIQGALRDGLGVDPHETFTTFGEYLKMFERTYQSQLTPEQADKIIVDHPEKAAQLKKTTVRSRVLRDWGIWIENVVVSDAQEVSGKLMEAAEKFAQSRTEQATRVVEADANRRKAMIEAEGTAAAILKVAEADQKAAGMRITGFSLGDKADEAGREAFLRWFYTDALAKGVQTSGRTFFYQWPSLPTGQSAFGNLYQQLQMLIQAHPELADPEKLAKVMESLGSSKPPSTA